MAGAGGPHEGVQVGAGVGEFEGAGLGRGGRVRGGIHQDPPQSVDGVFLAGPGQVHGVFGNPVGIAVPEGFVLVAFGDVVHDGGRGPVEAGEQPVGDAGGREGRDERDLRVDHRGDVGVGDEFRVTDQQEAAGPGEGLQPVHGVHDLGDFPGAAVVGAVQQRDGAVGGHSDTGLDLFEVGAPVFGVAVGRGRMILIDLVVGAVQGDRGHVPVQAGHVDTERVYGLGADRSDDVLDLGCDGVQGPAQTVVVEGVGRDRVDLLHGPVPRPVGHGDHRLRVGQPVGDQRLDDLPVADQGDITHRAGRIDDPRDIQPAGEVRDHRQRPQPLLQHVHDRDLRAGTPWHTSRLLRDTHTRKTR